MPCIDQRGSEKRRTIGRDPIRYTGRKRQSTRAKVCNIKFCCEIHGLECVLRDRRARTSGGSLGLGRIDAPAAPVRSSTLVSLKNGRFPSARRRGGKRCCSVERRRVLADHGSGREMVVSSTTRVLVSFRPPRSSRCAAEEARIRIGCEWIDRSIAPNVGDSSARVLRSAVVLSFRGRTRESAQREKRRRERETIKPYCDKRTLHGRSTRVRMRYPGYSREGSRRGDDRV